MIQSGECIFEAKPPPRHYKLLQQGDEIQSATNIEVSNVERHCRHQKDLEYASSSSRKRKILRTGAAGAKASGSGPAKPKSQNLAQQKRNAQLNAGAKNN